MVFNNKKQGQAAIEFLMTYGWMLLVVLIVGALIFSFVDFGSLLPAKTDFTSSNIKGDPQASNAYSQEASNGVEANMVYVAFTYTGAQRVTIDPTTTTLTDIVTKTDCILENLSNDATTDGSNNTAITFLNSQIGTAKFDCSTIGLIAGDSFEADINIPTTDPKRGRAIPNSGSIRLAIE